MAGNEIVSRMQTVCVLLKEAKRLNKSIADDLHTGLRNLYDEALESRDWSRYEKANALWASLEGRDSLLKIIAEPLTEVDNGNGELPW
ncbi:MAG: hypothetical protein LIR46_10150 [Bacteroidota bacterium]|nr:hypothetical protein [Bacteroidota bacterium]